MARSLESDSVLATKVSGELEGKDQDKEPLSMICLRVRVTDTIYIGT